MEETKNEETIETNNEETIETQEEEILTEEEAKELNGKTDEELSDIEKKNKKLYAQMRSEREQKKALREEKEKLQAKIKELEEIVGKTEEVKNKPAIETKEFDPIEFAKQVRKLSSLDEDEISYAQILAKGMGKSIDEVLETEDFKLWSSAHKEKIKQDNSHLNPNNKSVRTEQEDEFFKKFSANLPKGFEINK